jgi:hypothetical protein
MTELVLKNIDGIDFELTLEEAKFAMDLIKQKRENNIHFCKVTKLNDQKYMKNRDDGYITVCSQHISSIQIKYGDINYNSDNITGRGAISHVNTASNPKIFDIAYTTRGGINDGQNIKTLFIKIIKEKVLNDINNWNAMVNKMKEDNLIIDDHLNID